MHSETNSTPRHVVIFERNGVTHVTHYTVTEGIVRISNKMGLAKGPAKDDPEGEALRLFGRLVQTFEHRLPKGPNT